MISAPLTKLMISQDCNNVSPGGGGDRLILHPVISLVLSYGVKSAIISCLFLKRREARKFTGIRTRCESSASLQHRVRCHLEEGHHPGRLHDLRAHLHSSGGCAVHRNTQVPENRSSHHLRSFPAHDCRSGGSHQQ